MNEIILTILKSARPEFDFASSSDFIEDGYLDSFDIITVVSELENEFNVVIDGLDVLPENFVSIASITELVKKSEENE